LVLGNKIDIAGAEERAALLQEFLTDNEDRRATRLLTVSAKRLLNIDVLLKLLRELYDQHRTSGVQCSREISSMLTS